MPGLTPTIVRIKSLADWNNCFHHSTGTFRLPSQTGVSVHTLEIDLRYVDEFHLGKGNGGNEVYLPNVCSLILRGGEYCQDQDERVDCLTEVLSVINPIEVNWLHANGNTEDTFSLSTHMVHRTIINIGQTWSNLKNLVVQGGYPCPNLYAPTPFATTPGHTPLPSPKMSHATFSGLQGMATVHPTFPNDRPTTPLQPLTFGLTAFPEVPTHKSRHTDPARLAQRAERKRLCAYALKPRFDYAFGSWAPERLDWSFEGRYTSAAIRTVVTSLVKSFASTFPSASMDDDELDLPSLVAFKPVHQDSIPALQSAVLDLGLEEDVEAYLQDVVFIATTAVAGSAPMQYARLFGDEYTGDDQDRLARRWKAQAMLQGKDGAEAKIVSIAPLSLSTVSTPAANGLAPAPSSQEMVSPSYSLASLTSEASEGISEQEIITPNMRAARTLEPHVRGRTQSRSPSLEYPKKETHINMLGVFDATVPSATHDEQG